MIVTGIGRVATDVVLQKSANATEYVSFDIAHDRGFGEKKVTDWYRCVAYGEMAKRMANAQIKKGSALNICASQAIELYTKEGVDRTSVKLTILDWNFVSTGKKQSETNEIPTVSADDELPLV